MSTAGEIVTQSLRLIGVIAGGEEPGPDDAVAGLKTLQLMLDSWSIQSLTVYSERVDTITWPVSSPSITFGPSGSVVGVRPIQVLPATYYEYNSLSYPLMRIAAEEYAAISLKGLVTTYPTVMYVRMGVPDIEIFLYPIANIPLSLKLYSPSPLQQPPAWSTPLVFPPGYEQAIKFNLAYLLAPEFGRQATTEITTTAIASKRAIQRVNSRGPKLSFGSYWSNGGAFRYNIYSDGY